MNRPTLIILCGPPGAGKTTYAHKYIEEHPGTVHLSSDNIRKELYEDYTIQDNPSLVFDIMQKRAVASLDFGSVVIYDSTAMTRKDRAGIISVCPKFAKIECHIIWAPIETCIARDAARERTVGKEVIDRMLKRFQPVWYDEGVDEIKIIRPDDFNYIQYCRDVFDAMKIPHDNPHHTLNIYDHCCEAQRHANECITDDTGLVSIAAMWHDAGKPYVKSFVDSKGNPCDTAHFYSHQNLSAYISYGIAHDDPLLAWLIGNHMEPFFNTKYYQKLPSFLKNLIDLLHEADLAAH